MDPDRTDRAPRRAGRRAELRRAALARNRRHGRRRREGDPARRADRRDERGESAQTVALIRKVSEGRTLIMVEHDMGVVFGLADRISVLVYGRIVASDTPERIRENAEVQEAYLGQAAGP